MSNSQGQSKKSRESKSDKLQSEKTELEREIEAARAKVRELENLQKKQEDEDKFRKLAIIPEEDIEIFDIDKHSHIILDKIKEYDNKLKNLQNKMEKLNSKLKWMIYREQKYQESYGRVSNN